MILLDSCAVFEILFAARDADSLATFLENARTKKIDILLAPLIRLECSSVAAVRFKEGRFPAHDSFDSILAAINAFRSPPLADDMSTSIIEFAARIKSVHAASMVDCYLLANALSRRAAILTADKEILDYMASKAKYRKVGERFSAVSW